MKIVDCTSKINKDFKNTSNTNTITSLIAINYSLFPKVSKVK